MSTCRSFRDYLSDMTIIDKSAMLEHVQAGAGATLFIPRDSTTMTAEPPSLPSASFRPPTSHHPIPPYCRPPLRPSSEKFNSKNLAT